MRRNRYSRPLKCGWVVMSFPVAELGNRYPVVLWRRTNRPSESRAYVAAPVELAELCDRWQKTLSSHDATVSGVLADWIEDHMDMVLRHRFNRAATRRVLARRVLENVRDRMRECFAMPHRNRTD